MVNIAFTWIIPIHKCRNVKKFLEKTNFNILFAPPYHPEINPVEIKNR